MPAPFNIDREFGTLQNWVNGDKRTPTTESFSPVYSPYSGKEIASVPLSNAEDIGDAVSAARSAFPSWAETNIKKRVQVMFRLKVLLEDNLDELGELAALEYEHARGTTGLPDLLTYALGVVPHAPWMRTEGWTMDSMLQDLRFSTRVLLRSPGFTLVAAVTLALGIGANASIFSLVNGLMFRSPAGIHEPDRLVQIARSYESAPRWDNFSWPAMELIRDESRMLSGVAGYSGRSFVIGRGTETRQVPGQFVTGDYFAVLGVHPVVGRLVQPADDVNPGEHSVVVLSHSL